jgi:fucose permease
MGGLDVAMNAQAVEVERRLGRPIMSSMHAFFSLGGLVGSVAGAGLLTMPWSGATTMAVAAGMMALVAVPAGRWLLAESRPPREQRERLGAADILRPRLLAIGVLAFCALFAEGAVGDWSSLFLSRQTGASAAAAAMGFAAFSVTMTLARFAGDRAVARIGGRRSLVIGGLLAFAGMTLAIAIPQLWVGVIGFALMGLGFANMVPVLFSAAGRAGATPQAGIAVVSMIAYAGSLLGPPLIGGLSEHVGLAQALSLVAAFGLLVALGARAIPES